MRDVEMFHRPCKRIAVEKGGKRQVAGVNQREQKAQVDEDLDGTVRWHLPPAP
ncbi:MAG: hypothetical protein OXI87_24255 [Albidovulum sp.]|nr:hypothetical protein [Albidovulum sp.]MDE0530757.1 hypothetical protein [Albidovulum sp.]